MGTQGFGHVYRETRDWSRAVEFWTALGFRVEFATDHGSGLLVAPNGTRLFLAEQSPDDPLGDALYLDVDDAGGFDLSGFDVVQPFTPTHWDTQVAIVRDPDGREIRLEAPGP